VVQVQPHVFSTTPSTKIYFGHQRHETETWVSAWACAMDASAVFGGKLRACISGKTIMEVQAAAKYYAEDLRTRLITGTKDVQSITACQTQRTL
jgi:hypothetical protein